MGVLLCGVEECIRIVEGFDISGFLVSGLIPSCEKGFCVGGDVFAAWSILGAAGAGEDGEGAVSDCEGVEVPAGVLLPDAEDPPSFASRLLRI